MNFKSCNIVSNHWGKCRLGNEKLTKRAKFIGDKMLEKPDGLLVVLQPESYNS